MVIAGIVWAIGAVCAVALGFFVNRGAREGDARYSATEIGWGAVLWPWVILVLIVIEIYCRWQRRTR